MYLREKLLSYIDMKLHEELTELKSGIELLSLLGI